jgi:hypothetical protein
MFKSIDFEKIIIMLISIGFGIITFILTYYTIGLITTPLLEWLKIKLLGINISTNLLATEVRTICLV